MFFFTIPGVIILWLIVAALSGWNRVLESRKAEIAASKRAYQSLPPCERDEWYHGIEHNDRQSSSNDWW